MTTYPWLRAAASLTGVALIGAETYTAITYIAEPAATWRETFAQPQVINVTIAGLAQAVAALVMIATWHQRRYLLSVMTAVGLAAAAVFTFVTTYERTTSSREARRIAVEAKNGGGRVAASRVASAEARVAAECVVRGAECRKREAELGEARAALAAQPTALETRQLGRLDMVPEIALPLMMLILGLALIEFGLAPAGRSTPARLRPSDSAQTSLPSIEPPPASIFVPDTTPEAPEKVDERERVVSDFVRAYVKRNGRTPRHRDVMRATGLPKATTSRYLARVAAR